MKKLTALLLSAIMVIGFTACGSSSAPAQDATEDKTVVIVGGGNTAAADAFTLSRIAKKVILVHRRDTLRATKVYHEPLMKAAEAHETFGRVHMMARMKSRFGGPFELPWQMMK